MVSGKQLILDKQKFDVIIRERIGKGKCVCCEGCLRSKRKMTQRAESFYHRQSKDKCLRLKNQELAV